MVEITGFTSPLAMPVGTYTPFDTVESDDGVAIAAEVETVRGGKYDRPSELH